MFCSLKKLESLGFSSAAFTWIYSYLTGRSQAVMSEDGVLSEWIFTTAGVQQGSVLCPLLFSFIVNIRDRLRCATGLC